MALTVGLSPGDEGTLELRGGDSAYVADEAASLRTLLRAGRTNDPEGVRELQVAMKVTSVPLHTRVRVLAVDAIDRTPVAQVRLLYAGDALGEDAITRALLQTLISPKLYPSTGWVPAEWISRTQ